MGVFLNYTVGCSFSLKKFFAILTSSRIFCYTNLEHCSSRVGSSKISFLLLKSIDFSLLRYTKKSYLKSYSKRFLDDWDIEKNTLRKSTFISDLWTPPWMHNVNNTDTMHSFFSSSSNFLLYFNVSLFCVYFRK